MAPDTVSFVASQLSTLIARRSDDSVKTDLELTCSLCDAIICDIEDGDSMETLILTANTHECKGDDSEEMYVDYAGFRPDTDHIETPRNGASYCAVCGNVGDLEATSLAARIYHGDSFNLQVTYEEHEELEERATSMTVAELKQERCPECDSTNLRHHNRVSFCSDCRHKWEW